MTFLWAAPGGAGTPPPASVEHLAPAVAPAPVAPAVPEAPVATRVFFWAIGKAPKNGGFIWIYEKSMGNSRDLRRFMKYWGIHGRFRGGDKDG